MNYNEFAKKIKAKYPDYNDMDNKELATKVIAKYPEYNDVIFASNWDKKGNVYYTDVNGNKINDKGNLSPLEKLGRKAQAAADNISYWINNSNPKSEAYKQKVETILTLATLPLTGGAGLTKSIAAKLAPATGKAIAKATAQGITGGGVSGAAFGGLNGLVSGVSDEKKAPEIAAQSAIQSLTGGGLGALTGGALGLGGSKILQGIKGRSLKNFDTQSDGIKKLRNLETQYYKNYIQGTNVKRNDLGNINFTNAGLETVSKYPNAGKEFATLKKDIKNAKFIGEELPVHKRDDGIRDDGITKFYRLKNNDKEFLIGEDKFGKKYYLSKNNIKNDVEVSQPRGAESNTSSSLSADNNIITNSPENINPSQFGVREIDSNLNRQIAEQMNSNIIAEKELLNEYKNVHSNLVKEYGSIENLKSKAVSDMGDYSKYGIKSKAINDYQDLVTYEQLLQKARYVNSNIKSSVTGEVLPPNNPYIGSISGKPQEVKQVNRPILRPISKPPVNISADKPLNIPLPESLKSNPNSREFKQSRLPKNANLPEEIEKAVKKNPPEYEVLHNKDLIAQAVKDIENDPELSQKLINKAVSGDKNNKEFSALEFEQTRQLIDKLYFEGKNEEALNLTRLVSEAGSRAGQAVQAMSLWKRTTPAGAVKNAQHIIDEFNKTVKDPKKQIKLTDENINKIKELTENIHKAPEGREKDVATALLLKYEKELVPPSMSNKLKTLRNMSLLLNPKTFNRNLTGNAIFGGVENLLAKPLAAGIDKLISPITKQRTRVLPKGGTYLKGLWQGLKEGNEDVLKGINTRDKIGQRFDIQRKSFDKGLLGGLETALNWSLQVPDRMFYQAAFNESLANQMAAAGTKKATNDMLKRAEQEALEAVFQNNSVLSNGVTGLRKVLNGNGNFGLGDAAIPYAQTPANITQQSINYSPFGYTKAIENLLKGDQRQATLDTARATIGTGIIGGGYELGKHGIISAIDRDDYDVQKNYAAAGTRPYSLKLPNGNRISGLSMLAPIGTTLVAGTALNDIDKNGDYKNALNSSIDTLLEASYLQTLQKMAEDTREGDWIGAAMEPVLGLPSQFVPTALNQINAYVDPYSRETRNDNPLIKSYNQAINKIPFASKTLPIKYDVTGEPIKRYDREGIAKLYDVSLNPFYYNTQKDNPELKEVLRLYEQTGDKGVLYNTPPSTVRFKALNGEQKNIKLTGKDYSEYQKTAGKISSNTLKKIINSDVYKNLPDDKKAELIKITHQKAEELTKETLFDKPNAKVRGALRKLSTREMKTAEEKAVDDIFKTVKKMFKAADLTDDYNLDFSFPIQQTEDDEE